MKRQFVKTMQHIAALMLGVFLTLGHVAQAAPNTGIGDVAGVGADLGDSNTFNLSSASSLVLVKTAYLVSSGVELADNDTVPAGSAVDFMIFINNDSSVQVDDVTIQDILHVDFTYQAGTIRIDSSIADCGVSCDAAERLVVYNAAKVTGALLDTIELGDTGSYNAPNIDAGDENVANGQLDAPANSVLALVFTVVVP